MIDQVCLGQNRFVKWLKSKLDDFGLARTDEGVAPCALALDRLDVGIKEISGKGLAITGRG